MLLLHDYARLDTHLDLLARLLLIWRVQATTMKIDPVCLTQLVRPRLVQAVLYPVCDTGFVGTRQTTFLEQRCFDR